MPPSGPQHGAALTAIRHPGSLGLSAVAPAAWRPAPAERRRIRRQAALATLWVSGLWCTLFMLGGAPAGRSRPPVPGDAPLRDPAAVPITWLRLLPDAPVPQAVSVPGTAMADAKVAARSPALQPPRASTSPDAPTLQVLPGAAAARDAAVDPASTAVAAAPAASVASAPPPLRLDGEVLRSAIRASKGLVQRQAEASGAYMGDEPVSKQEKLARAIAGSAKPGCLEQGGSLLAVFTIAYAVVADKCQGLSK